MFPIPKAFFLTRGIGTNKEQLTAFELAFRDADIEQQNLVTVSSILPPGCIELDRDGGSPRCSSESRFPTMLRPSETTTKSSAEAPKPTSCQTDAPTTRGRTREGIDGRRISDAPAKIPLDISSNLVDL